MKFFRRRVINFQLAQVLLFIGIACSQASCVNTSKQLDFKKVESNTNCGIVSDDADFMIISDAAAFRELYANIHSLQLPRPAPPDIDFNRYHVLLAFTGEKSTAGHSIEFYDVVSTGNDEIKVTMSLKSPQPGTDLAQVVTNPYAIAKVAKGSYETAKFVDQLNEVLAVVKVN